MWDEDDKDDGLGVARGFVNAFLITVLVGLIFGYAWRAMT